MDFAADLNRVLKYSTGDWKTFEKLLRSGADHSAPGSHTRGVAADWLDDHTDRSSEAALLRSEHPVYFWRGGIHRGRSSPLSSTEFTHEYRANEFANEYVTAAMNHTPIDPVGDPEALEHGTIGEHFDHGDFDHDTLRELREDGKHFYHSHGHLIPPGMRTWDAASAFWDDRNGNDGVGFLDYPYSDTPEAQSLHKAAFAAGPYHFNIEPTGPDAPDDPGPHRTVITGRGGEHRWGQEPGLR